MKMLQVTLSIDEWELLLDALGGDKKTHAGIRTIAEKIEDHLPIRVSLTEKGSEFSMRK